MSMNWDEQLTIGAELDDGHDAAADGDADPTKVEGIAMATIQGKKSTKLDYLKTKKTSNHRVATE
jgi:hypothetical protein